MQRLGVKSIAGLGVVQTVSNIITFGRFLTTKVSS
jgi:hypothetical protein